MPWWPFRREPQPLAVFQSLTYELERRANIAYNAKRWDEAARLYSEVLAKADKEGRQVARNRLGLTYERLGHVDEAIRLYEANVAERSPFTAYYERLAILYRRLGRADDERRVLTIASQQNQHPKARQWYIDRLRKLR